MVIISQAQFITVSILCKEEDVTDSKNSLPSKVLIVDDTPQAVSKLKEFLTKQGILVVNAVDMSSAIYQFNSQIFEVVLISNDFREVPCLSVAQRFKSHPDFMRNMVSILVMSNIEKRNKGDDVLAIELGDIEFFSKTANPAQILTPLARSVTKRQNQIKIKELEAKALEYYKSDGNLTKAIELIKSQLSTVGEKGKDILLNLYIEADKTAEALELVNDILAKKAEKSEPIEYSIKLINTKASLLLKLGEMAEARKTFEQADQIAPKNIKRMEEMAEMYLEMAMPKEAMDKFKDLIATQPDKPSVKFEAFESLTDHGFNNEAKDFCRELVAPKEVMRHYNNMGVMSSKESDYKKAIDQYEYAIKLLPKSPDIYKIHFNLGIAYINLKTPSDLQKGKQCLEKTLALKPDFEKAKVILDKLNSPTQSAIVETPESSQAAPSSEPDESPPDAKDIAVSETEVLMNESSGAIKAENPQEESKTQSTEEDAKKAP